MLDASASLAALLAAMLGEPGASAVAAVLPDSCVSAVNLSEVVAKLAERGVIEESLADLNLDIRVFDARRPWRPGSRAPRRRRWAFRGAIACLALAAALGATAVTCDAAWARIDLCVTVDVVR